MNETLYSTEILRVTLDGQFIWHKDADRMIEKGDFTASPAMPHILKALRKRQPVSELTDDEIYDAAHATFCRGPNTRELFRMMWTCNPPCSIGWDRNELKAFARHVASLYTAPPQRPWVGLTDEEIKTIEEATTCAENESWLHNLTINIEAKLKGEEHMSEPVIFGFGAATSTPDDYPLEFTGHYIIGGNPETEETGGYWDTEEQAIINFALQFAKLSAHAQGGFLFVRRAPVVSKDAVFEGDVKWKMIGRFSTAKIKEKE